MGGGRAVACEEGEARTTVSEPRHTRTAAAERARGGGGRRMGGAITMKKSTHIFNMAQCARAADEGQAEARRGAGATRCSDVRRACSNSARASQELLGRGCGVVLLPGGSRHCSITTAA